MYIQKGVQKEQGVHFQKLYTQMLQHFSIIFHFLTGVHPKSVQSVQFDLEKEIA